MIIILKRDDLPRNLRDWAMESLKLDHFARTPELVEQAELIVFVEGSSVKFLKQREDVRSKNSLDVSMSYITSAGSLTKERIPYSVKRARQWKQTK